MSVITHRVNALETKTEHAFHQTLFPPMYNEEPGHETTQRLRNWSSHKLIRKQNLYHNITWNRPTWTSFSTTTHNTSCDSQCKMKQHGLPVHLKSLHTKMIVFELLITYPQQTNWHTDNQLPAYKYTHKYTCAICNLGGQRLYLQHKSIDWSNTAIVYLRRNSLTQLP